MVVVRMVGIDKVVVLAGLEDSVVAAEHVVFEGDLEVVGMDGRPLGNNWDLIALVEADSTEVGFVMKVKSLVEDLRQVGSVDRRVERIKTGKADEISTVLDANALRVSRGGLTV